MLLSREESKAQFLEVRSSIGKWATVKKELFSPRGRRLKMNLMEMLKALGKRGAVKAASRLRHGLPATVTFAGFCDLVKEWDLAPLTVQDDLTGELVELGRYARLPETTRVILAPPRVYLEIYFPHADLVKRERFSEGAIRDTCAQALSNQPRQSAFVRVKGRPVARVRTLDVEEPEARPSDVERLKRQSLLEHGQSRAQVEAELRWRREEIDRRREGESPIAPAPPSRDRQTTRKESPKRGASERDGASPPGKTTQRKMAGGQSRKVRSVKDVVAPVKPKAEARHEDNSLE